MFVGVSIYLYFNCQKQSKKLENSLNHKLNEQDQKLKMMQQQINNFKTQIGK